MTSLLIALLVVMLAPLFLATWRTSLLGIASQGLLLGWIAYRQHPEPSLHMVLTLVDLVLLRGLVAPLLLYGELRRQQAPRRNDVIPPNMLSWTLAVVLVVLAFQFAERVVPGESEAQTLVAVAAAGVLLALLVLSSQSVPFSQMMGALRLSNAIALFELGSTALHEAPAVRIGHLVVYVLTVALFTWYLRTLSRAAPEGPTVPPL